MHPHQLRHAFATSWLAEGGNENELMLVAGWKSRIMIDRYTKATAVERAMPACHQATGCRPQSSAIRRSCRVPT
jgi:integrase